MWWPVILVVVTACRVNGVDFTGKPCPCPGGYSCDPTTSTCARNGDFDAGDDSATGDDATGDDAPNAATYRDAVIADAPIAYWRLGDSGTTARDEMGNYNGTYSGTCVLGVPGALAGDTNPAVHFDGSTCQITLPDQLAFLGTAPYSVEAWAEKTVTVAGYRTIFSKESRAMGPVDGYALVDSSTGVYFERAVDQTAPTTTHLTLPTGRFVHLVGVYDGTQFVLYIDAIPETAVPDAQAMPAFSAAALIGADSSGDFFVGTLDEIAVYDHALGAARIALHHQIGVAGP